MPRLSSGRRPITATALVSLVNRQSGLALDVWAASTADGARISQWTHTGNSNQRFQLQRP